MKDVNNATAANPSEQEGSESQNRKPAIVVDPVEKLSNENRAFYEQMLAKAATFDSVDAGEYTEFLRAIGKDVRRYLSERFLKDACYRFADSVYKGIMRNMKHKMPSEVNLDAILPIVSLMYTI